MEEISPCDEWWLEGCGDALGESPMMTAVGAEARRFADGGWPRRFSAAGVLWSVALVLVSALHRRWLVPFKSLLLVPFTMTVVAEDTGADRFLLGDREESWLLPFSCCDGTTTEMVEGVVCGIWEWVEDDRLKFCCGVMGPGRLSVAGKRLKRRLGRALKLSKRDLSPSPSSFGGASAC